MGRWFLNVKSRGFRFSTKGLQCYGRNCGITSGLHYQSRDVNSCRSRDDGVWVEDIDMDGIVEYVVVFPDARPNTQVCVYNFLVNNMINRLYLSLSLSLLFSIFLSLSLSLSHLTTFIFSVILFK